MEMCRINEYGKVKGDGWVVQGAEMDIYLS